MAASLLIHQNSITLLLVSDRVFCFIDVGLDFLKIFFKEKGFLEEYPIKKVIVIGTDVFNLAESTDF